LSEFGAVRPSGLIAVNLDPGDVLGWARLTSGDDQLVIVTAAGRALRFHESKVRAMGRQAAGVRAIRLKEGDFVTSVDVVDPKGDLLVVTRNGYGKRTPLQQYTPKGRGTGGVTTLNLSKMELTGLIAAAMVVHDEDDLTIISSGGIVLRTKVKQIKRAGRATMGVRVIKLNEGETVASVARIAAKDLKAAGVEAETRPAESPPPPAG
ncbi:MAG: DNA gyrase C-terminal beta-propeller domain-containing protein, partial [Anaerolineales bacterium]